MKKVLVLLLSFTLILLSGCSGSVADDKFLSAMPWTPPAISTALGEEICEYQMTRYAGGTDGTKITKSNSSLIYTLKEGYSFELTDGVANVVQNPDHTLLTAKLSVYYNNTEDVHEIYRGKEDFITSYCAFDRFSLNPKKTYRIADTIEAAHILSVDYTTGKATLKEGTSEKTMNIKSGGYDNESLYYTLRGLSTLTEGGSTTLPLILAYDDFKYKKGSVKSKDIIQSTASELVDVSVTSSVYRQFFDDESTEYKLSCYETSVGLNTAKSGTPTKLYYSKQETRVDSAAVNSVSYKAKNVLVKIEYPLYGYLSGSLALDYTQVFELVRYTNK